MFYNETLDVVPLNDYTKVCNSCTIHIVLFAVFFITSIYISIVFIFLGISKMVKFILSLIPGTRTTIY